MKYTAHLTITLGFDMEIEARNATEAELKLLKFYRDMDFNSGEYIDGDYTIYAEHEDVRTDVDEYVEMDYTEFSEAEAEAVRLWLALVDGRASFKVTESGRRYLVETWDFTGDYSSSDDLVREATTTIEEWEKESPEIVAEAREEI